MQALEATGWHIKAAILMLVSGAQMDAETAVQRVAEFGGHLRNAIEASNTVNG